MKIQLYFNDYETDNIEVRITKQYKFVIQDYKVTGPASHKDDIYVDVTVDKNDNLLDISYINTGYHNKYQEINKENFIRAFSDKFDELGIKHNYIIQKKLDLGECLRLD